MTHYDNSTSARSLLDSMGISEYLQNPTLTEIMINRPQEVFLEDADGRHRIGQFRPLVAHGGAFAFAQKLGKRSLLVTH